MAVYCGFCGYEPPCIFGKCAFKDKKCQPAPSSTQLTGSPKTKAGTRAAPMNPANPRNALDTNGSSPDGWQDGTTQTRA